MQDGTTADMIFDVPALIEFISQPITLEPGDVIATGTPAGVGVFRDPPVFLEPGDRVRCEIEGIGSVENPIVDWTDDPRRRLSDERRRRPAAGGRCSPWSRPRPGPACARDRAGPDDRHQRRPDPGPQDRHLRHRPAHRVVGRLGGEDDPAAARRRPRVRRRDRRGRLATSPTSSRATSSAARATSSAAAAATAWPAGATCAPTPSGLGVGRDGAFAEYVALPMTNIWHHWPGIDEEVAAIFDPFGNAVHTALAFPVLGEDVLVTGAGPIGLMATAVVAPRRRAPRRGHRAERVPPRARRCGWARPSPSTRASATSHDVQRELGMVEGFDVALEMSGNAAALRDRRSTTWPTAAGSRMLGIPTERDRARRATRSSSTS